MRAVTGIVGVLIVVARGAFAVSVSSDEPVLDITGSLEVLESEHSPDDVEAVADSGDHFRPLDGPDLHFGYIGGVYWFRLSVDNTGPSSNFLLELNNAQLSRATLYVPEPGGGYASQTAGVDVPFFQRPFPALTPTFGLALDAGQHQICYLRVDHYGALRFSAMIRPEKAGWRHASFELALNAMLAGALLGLALYNGCVYFGLRQPAYFWLSLMLLGLALNQMTFSGAANLLLWSGPGKWADHAFTLTGVSVISFGIAGSMSFLNIAKSAPRLAKLAVAFVIFGVGAGLASLLRDPVLLYGVVTYLLGTPVLIGAMAVRAVRHRSVSIDLFLGSWGLVLFGCLLFGLAYLDVLPDNALTMNFMYVAGLGASVAWSFALTRQIKTQASRQRARLEYKVARRTVELEAALGDVKELRGLLPICSSCKRVLDADGDWHVMESYIANHTGAETSPRICPDCASGVHSN